jgi:hypothetical protein
MADTLSPCRILLPGWCSGPSLSEKSDSFRILNFRSSTGGSFIPSNRFTSLASFVWAWILSCLACEEIASVSSVMKFACTQAARSAFTERSFSIFSVSAMNFSASATVGLALRDAGVRDKTIITERNRTAFKRLRLSITGLPNPIVL